MTVHVHVEGMVVVRLASWLPVPHPVPLLLKLLHQVEASLQMHLVQYVVMALNAAQLMVNVQHQGNHQIDNVFQID